MERYTELPNMEFTGTWPRAMSAAQAYDLLAPEYDGNFQKAMFLAENEVIRDLILEQDCARGDVLDLGCGTGLFLEYIPKDPRNYIGIDPSLQMLQRAQAKFPEFAPCFIQSGWEHLPTLRKFDSAVALFGPFNYVQDQLTALRALREVLRPGGRFFIMSFTARYHQRKSYIVSSTGLEVPFATFTARQLLEMGSRFGFTDLDLTPFHMCAESLIQGVQNRDFIKSWLRAEMKLARGHPDWFYYNILTGQKGAE